MLKHEIVYGILFLVLICIAIIGVIYMSNATYITEGIIVDSGYMTPYWPHVPIEQDGYYWIDVYDNKTKNVRRVRVEGLDGYQIGDFWKEP